MPASSHLKKHYEYHGLMAETWDLLRGDPSGRSDRDFYLAMIERYGEPMLDLGCGTGRLLLDFLAEGITIDGVDISPDMLRLCRQKAACRGLAPCLHEQDLETLALPRRYKTILAPSSVLQLVTGQAAVLQAVRHIYHHLSPGGALVAPFMTLWKEGMPLTTEWEAAQVRPEDGALLQRRSRVWFDRAAQCEHTEDLYTIEADGHLVAVEHHRRSPASRSYSQDQAHTLFANAGFAGIIAYCGFTLQPAAADDRLFTLVGVKDMS